MKFSPLQFQISVAAGGAALMPFVLLQFAVPHGEGLITMAAMPWEQLSAVENFFYGPLVGVMLLFVVIHLLLTLFYLKGLAGMMAQREQFSAFINDPKVHIAIFSPIASLAMTANVVWGPLAFFVPNMGATLQGLMLPSLFFFALLWLALLGFEAKVLKIWLTQPVEPSKLNFAWLLDIFAFGLVSLTGSGIAAIATDPAVAAAAAFAAFFTIGAGIFIFLLKIVVLLYGQLKAQRLPGDPIQPAFFLVIPILCLFGISLFRIMAYLQNHFGFAAEPASFLVLNFAYAAAVAWAVFGLYLLADYFRKFGRQKYSPAQWGIV
ncbi:conserved hypothetical protein [Desulfurivibrio alkaliphilus AHT 2]|uniref:Uncharacterized protein n=2 Tax=Desulfurivibrio alkaliphilus TaxID=427923 RepID=D6Z429_DESAT|nr:hypothetical protein [Desulfurivibrio alkaliphilus]ADH86304.1 conserved hypothetical protein [Desulfurivibrio alkaliphilus AHT 2]